MGIGVIILTWYFGQDIYLKEKPFFLKKETYLDDFVFFNITNKNFFYAVRMETESNSPNISLLLKPEYFEFEVYFDSYKGNLTTGEVKRISRKNYSLIMCNNSILVDRYKNNKLIPNFLCAPYIDTYLGGDYVGSKEFNLLSYNIKRCNKDTESKYNTKCKSDSEISDNFGSLFIANYYQVNLINPENPNDFLNEYYIYDYINYNPTESTTQKATYSISELSTDKGWIFEESIDDKFIEFQTNKITTGEINEVTDIVFTNEIYIFLNIINFIQELI